MIYRPNLLKAAFGTLFLLYCLPGNPAFAAENSANPSAEQELADMSLEDLLGVTVTTASKTEKSLEDSPSIISVWTRAEIKRLGAKKLIDLLALTPGFYEVSGPLGRNMAIRGVHGYGSQHFVVLIDGIPVNDFITASSPADSFDLEPAERVEIIRGPGSALYGANALMGVINIITREGKTNKDTAALTFNSSTFQNISTDFRFSRGLNFAEKGNLFMSAAVFNNFGSERILNPENDVLLSKTGQNIADGIQEGENLTRPLSGVPVNINRYDPSFDLFFKYTGEQDWEAKMNLSQLNYVPQRSLSQSLVDFNREGTRPFSRITRLLLDGEKKFGNKETDWGQLLLRPSVIYQGYDYSAQNLAKAEYSRIEDQETPLFTSFGNRDIRYGGLLEYNKEFGRLLDVFGDTSLVAGLQGNYSITDNSYLELSYLDKQKKIKLPGPDSANGLDLYTEKGSLLNEGMTIDPFGNLSDKNTGHFGDGDEYNLGTYLQLTSFLFDRVGVTVGSRLDYAPDFTPQLSPRVAVSGNIYQGLYGKMLYSSAFVYPTFLYRVANSFSPYEGNTEIKPQSIDSLEMLLGYRQENFRLELNGYYNKVKNFITYDDRKLVYSGKYRFTNQGNLEVFGLEMNNLFYLLDKSLFLNLGGSWQMPLSGTDPRFNPNGSLGGPAKFPDLTGFIIANYSPLKPLNINLSLIYSSQVHLAAQAGGLTFSNVTGTDGASYSSLPLNAYDTQNINLNARVSYEFLPGWEVYLQGRNLLNRRNFIPGSTLVPYPVEGLTLFTGISFN